MTIRKIYQIAFFIAFLLPGKSNGQISQGGIPIQINKQKSASFTTDLVVMPAIDNLKMRDKYSRTDQNMLKQFHFAHSFDVSLSPNNSGKWYNTSEVNVWQIRIRSTGAYSLNLILHKFRLPDGARLFLIGSNTGEIKGAYTSANNSDSQVLAIEPVSGDELLVQYEEPVGVSFRGEFLIAKVAHDFVGITGDGVHRPLGISGSCNKNVNCDLANGDESIRDAVCRIIIEGTEICSGSMINNTALDGIPYILTASHCIGSEIQAESSVFLFNYEMPYCSPNNPSTDGDIKRSLSGSSLKALFDSINFALVRLNNIPPYNYRPYLIGWNRINTAPAYSSCIHHPLGDIKKVSIDWLPAQTGTFSSGYQPNGFWKILKWDIGVTEPGSSGGPLFDQNKQLVGALTGGSATCNLPTNDYFLKFALAWDYRKETGKQLKAWLDPLNSGASKLTGMYLYSGKMLCKPVTNFKDNDTHAAIQITNGLTKKGYYSGSNLVGFTEFAEQYKFSKNCEVQGVSLGIAKVKTNPLNASSLIGVQVYSGVNQPETLLYTEKFVINRFYNDAMNYISFQTPV
ncbi:MAG TPA: trypsin-like peptidase domain-containing protein, partial [Prolixibacteraceae bacterium]